MKITWMTFSAAAVVACAGPMGASAQSPAATAASSAAPETSKNGPRLLSPNESRNIGAAPGELRPERPVTPQISVPLGRRDRVLRDEQRRDARGRGDAGVNPGDAAARCEAQRGEQVRAKCRDDLARQERTR